MSLENKFKLLCRYLPYEIKVSFQYKDPYGKDSGPAVSRLDGLERSPDSTDYYYTFQPQNLERQELTEDVLPLLYPFDNLDVNILTEFSRILVPKTLAYNLTEFQKWILPKDSFYLKFGNGDDCTKVVISSDWKIKSFYNSGDSFLIGHENYIKAVEFLVSKKFAVGLDKSEFFILIDGD